MSNRKPEPRYDGNYDRSYVLPEDLEGRLERHRQASGLTWSGLARAVGVSRRQVCRWRTKGMEPSGQIGGK